jgi:NAD(P)-dependent dehydrogenase (short-subunit alcohol dehydrogenase family)
LGIGDNFPIVENSRKILVTGSRGMAAALIEALNSQGIQTYALGGELEDGESLKSRCKHLVGFNPIDLRDESAVESGFKKALVELGNITDVVSIAGGSGRSFGDGPIHTMSREAWDKTFELNLTTAFLTAREAIKIFQKNGGGSLILTTSVLAASPSPEHFQTHGYAASKAAISGLVKTLSASYITENIRVNAIAPGLVATPMAARAATNPVISEFTKRKQPLVKAQLPIENLVSGYLALLENSAITGQILTIDGGWSTVTNI